MTSPDPDASAPVSRGSADLIAATAAAFDRLEATGTLSEHRPGQRMMAGLVADAIATRSPVVIRSGTGTGKSAAYLVPLVLSGVRGVVSTATRVLQTQLGERDLPLLVERLEAPARIAVLKGRPSYACRQKVAELRRAPADTLTAPQRSLVVWEAVTPTGDRVDLPAPVSDAAWRSVSVGPDQCPGGDRCPSGATCFSEVARARAAEADIVVTNHHLYAAAMFASGSILAPHDAVVFDEAHALAEVTRQAVAARVDPVRWAALARRAVDVVPVDHVVVCLDRLAEQMGPCPERPQRRVPSSVMLALGEAGEALRRCSSDLRSAVRETDDHPLVRLGHAMSLAAENAALASVWPTRWVEGRPDHPVLRALPPSEQADARRLWEGRAAVFTSATLDGGFMADLSLDERVTIDRTVASPFAYEDRALLYCAAHLPTPGEDGRDRAVAEEVAFLATAARGRTLVLFTSWRVLRAVAGEVRELLTDVELVVQETAEASGVIARLSGGSRVVALGTIGLAQGIDLPGALSVVAVDRIPFPARDDPALVARRRDFGSRAFAAVDLRMARASLAQCAGRLIRTADDRGVFAVLDPRLATAPYRWDLVRSVPPMRRSKHPDEVREFLVEA